MSSLRIGDVVTRKSYGGDIYFTITDISTRSNGKKTYILKGMLYRIMADSDENDLEWKNSDDVRNELRNRLSAEGIHHMSRGFPSLQLFQKVRGKSGKILHIDSSSDFLEMCQSYYKDAKIRAYGYVIPESEQPNMVRGLLASTKADILIATGHDGLKKNAVKMDSLESYRNSRYFVQTAQIARKFEPSFEKLCIFSGACQSYFEGIMKAGANFASSPGRILIHALDPAKVGDRIALTDSRRMVTPEQIARLTQSGSKGIGGIRTKGHYILQ
ncbi:MAG: sporulation peptidase YabG [Clostridiaceae bacterium]|jgi:spore coat assembly protein|nr:sporulation peptidase YabG [Clostridiaceae bacterium]